MITCTDDGSSSHCAVASTEATCSGGLVCSGAAPTAGCNCPTTDTGNAGGACSSVGLRVCEASGADGLNNVIECTSVTVGGQTCLQWQVLGGAGDEGAVGNCHAAGVTCDAQSHTCTCPANTSSVFFANPVPSRTAAESRSIATTGVQFPAVCAFPTATAALNKATQLIAGTSNRATVVLAGGTPLVPALFTSEPSWPLTIPDRILMTVDTDTQVIGITPQGVFDPRREVLVVAPTNGSPATGVVLGGGTNGGQVNGFTIISGPCVTGSDAGDCTNHAGTALSVSGAGSDGPVNNGTRARVSSMMLEGGGGNIVATGADLGALTITAGSAGQMTGSITSTTSLVGVTSITILPDTGVPASIPFAGVYALTSAPVQGSGNVWTFTFQSNVLTAPPASVTNYSVSTKGAFAYGLVLSNSAGSIANLVAENFSVDIGEGDANGAGVVVESANSPAGYPISGLYLFNNSTGLVALSGLVTLSDTALGAGLPGFPVAAHPTVDHSLSTGVVVAGDFGKLPAPVDAPRVIATGLTVTNTTGTFNADDNFGTRGAGIDIGATGSVSLSAGTVTGNAGDGVIVEGPDPTVGTPVFAALNSTFTANFNGVEVFQGNTTFNASHLDGNTSGGAPEAGVGLLVNADDLGTTISMTGGTVNGNTLGILAENDAATVSITGTTISSNQLQGILASTGAFTLSGVTVTANAASNGSITCEQEPPNLLRTQAAVFIGSSSAAISGSHVDANNGGGLVFGSSGPNTITGTTADGNGKASNDCNDDFSGIVVDGSGLTIGTGVSASTNANYGLEVIDSSVNSTGITASTNINSGIIFAEGEGPSSGTFATATTTSNNCGTGHAEVCAGVENHGIMTINPLTSTANGGQGVWNSGSLTLSNATITGNTAEGVKNAGGFVGATLTITGNTADGFLSASTVNSTVIDSLVARNGGDGVHVLATSIPGDPFGTDAAISAFGLELGNLTVSANTGSGVVVGGDGQTGNISVYLHDSDVGANSGSGLVAVGSATNGGRTAITAINNQIVQNIHNGLFVQQAYVKDATLFGSQFFPGISSNIIAHNGFALSDTECSAGETDPQIVFAGTDPLPTTAPFDCGTQMSNDACVLHRSDRCAWISDSTQCRRAYQLNGSVQTASCNQGNTIAGYQGHFTGTPTKDVVGVYATAGALGTAFVNASNNIWPRQAPGLGSDYSADAGAGVGPLNVTGCTPTTLSGLCPLYTPAIPTPAP